jgi:hypothetical protein
MYETRELTIWIPAVVVPMHFMLFLFFSFCGFRQRWLSDWKSWTEKYEITNQSVQGDKTKPDSTKLVTRASACGS